jgi:phage/plasmid-associated DNA primase
MDAFNSRIAFIEELDKGNKLNSALFKQIVDGNEMKLERLHANGTISFTPSFYLVMTSNPIPRFENQDQGVNTRWELIKCMSEFGKLDNPEKLKFKANDNFKTLYSTKDYKEAMVYLMLDEIKKFYKNGCELPVHRSFMKDEIGDIKNSNNMFKEFLDDHYEITNNPNDRVGKRDIQEHYSDYTKRHFNMRPSSDTFILENLQKYNIDFRRTFRVGNLKGAFIGIRLSTKTEGENLFINEEEDDGMDYVEAYDIHQKKLKEQEELIRTLNSQLEELKNVKKTSKKVKKELKDKKVRKVKKEKFDYIEASKNVDRIDVGL